MVVNRAELLRTFFPAKAVPVTIILYVPIEAFLAACTVVIEVADIGRTIHRHEHRVVAADLYGPLGIARMEGEFGRDFRHQLHQQAAIDANTGLAHIGTRGPPYGNRLGIAEF